MPQSRATSRYSSASRSTRSCEAGMISLGLIGCGTVVHTNYAKTLVGRDAYTVHYVCDTNQVQAMSAAALFDANVVSLDTLVDKAEAIIISTPPSTHSSLVRACLRPGRTILCEKPYMTTHRDAVEVCEASQTLGAHVYVGHFRRAFPHLELARELVALGLIGEVTGFSASEGGRFTWKAISNYPIQDPNGGVLWDTGSHTVDMALFASGLDRYATLDVRDIRVEKDKAEPSHDFQADFKLAVSGQTVDGRVHVSRKEALPNLIRISGSRGQLAFVTDMDDRVRLTTATGSTVLRTERSYVDLIECLDLQLRRVLLAHDGEPFAAENFVGQIKLIEALANA
jgi:predicted dehydrogenase